MEEIKTSSNAWINQKKFTKFKFAWQRGYGAFSHSHSTLSKVIHYITNQHLHHQKRSFRAEYLEMLNKHEIKYKEEYLFDFHEDNIQKD